MPSMRYLLPLLLVAGCSTANKVADPPNGLSPDRATSQAPYAQKAEAFDRYVHGKVTQEELAVIKDACTKAPTENPFCFSFQRLDILDRKILAKNKKVRPQEIKRIIVPLPPAISGSKISNWKMLRNGKVPSLLKGIEGLDLPTLRQIAKRAGKEKRCPNNIGVALAATLEDYIPQVTVSEVTALYKKGANCAKREPTDRENYLTRSGLLHFQKKEYKKAVAFFKKAVEVDNTSVSRPLYWLFRTEVQLNETVPARHASEELLANYPFSLHSLIVATQLGKDPGEVLDRPPLPVVKRSQKVDRANALIEQAEILKTEGFDESSSLVADWALDDASKLEPEVRAYVAEMADPHNRLRIASDLISRKPSGMTKQLLGLYFPKAYFGIFEKNNSGLDPFLLLSVARQESTFKPNAISPANAQGLMQIHPDTGRKLNSGSPYDLLDPELNVAMGSRYLVELLKRWNGRLFLAVAAYNAGEEKLATWIARYPVSDPILFIDLISYRETRGYVASVLRNYYWYRRIYHPEVPVKRVLDPDSIDYRLPSSETPTASPKSDSVGPVATPNQPQPAQ